MSRKNDRPYNLILAFIILVGMGGVLGVSSLNVRVSLTGTLLVIVAVFESALILGGFVFLNPKRQSPSTDESS